MEYQPILSISNGTLVGSVPGCLEGHRIQPSVDMPRALGIIQLANVGNPTTFFTYHLGMVSIPSTVFMIILWMVYDWTTIYIYIVWHNKTLLNNGKDQRHQQCRTVKAAIICSYCSGIETCNKMNSGLYCTLPHYIQDIECA